MRWVTVVVVSLVVASSAFAAPKADPKSDALAKKVLAIDSESEKVHVALFGSETTFDEAVPLGELRNMLAFADPIQPLSAFSSDGSVGWFATNLYGSDGSESAERMRKAKRDAATKPEFRVTALVDGDQIVFVHFAHTSVGDGHGDPPLTQAIADDAKPVVALFRKTIANPKEFAATVSPRTDALLVGSQPRERFVGGATVRATLATWGLSFTTVGGVVAGIAKSKTVAWVIADVDAVGRKGGKPAPYRVTVVYEKTGGEWKIVQLHFS